MRGRTARGLRIAAKFAQNTKNLAQLSHRPVKKPIKWRHKRAGGNKLSCLNCEKRYLGCQDVCPEKKKEDFFRYLEKERRKKDQKPYVVYTKKRQQILKKGMY